MTREKPITFEFSDKIYPNIELPAWMLAEKEKL